MLTIDHVMYVVADLDDAAHRIRSELGLDSYDGGSHTGLGTGNRIVPVGDDEYIELIGVTDTDVASQSPLGQVLAEYAREGDRLRSWCVRTDDIDALADRLGLAVVPMGRTLPDGTHLSWRLAGAHLAMAEPALPFFIQWDGPHPARVTVAHETPPLGITSIEIAGDATRVAEWISGADLRVRFVDGEPGPQAVRIATADGELVLR